MYQSVGIVDYGMGNISSLQNAISELGWLSNVISEPSELLSHQKIILPGVGAFCDAMKSIRDRGFLAPLNTFNDSRRDVLGICLGMQLMCRSSEEDGHHEGLGWFDAEVKKMENLNHVKIPHIGWNDVKISKKNQLMDCIPDGSDFYFVHSYHVRCNNEFDVLTKSSHGVSFVSSIQNSNLFGVQFHPEKSQDKGLYLIKNFLECQNA